MTTGMFFLSLAGLAATFILIFGSLWLLSSYLVQLEKNGFFDHLKEGNSASED